MVLPIVGRTEVIEHLKFYFTFILGLNRTGDPVLYFKCQPFINNPTVSGYFKQTTKMPMTKANYSFIKQY